MKFTIKHEGNTINATLPSSWNDLTVKQFTDLNNDLNQLELLSSLSGLNLSFIENSNTDLTPAIEYLNKMFSKAPPNLVNQKRKNITFEGKIIKPPKNLNLALFGQKIMIKNIIEGEDKLVCDICKKYYPIKEGIPVMLIDEAVDYMPEEK